MQHPKKSNRCGACLLDLPLSSFHIDKASSFGHSNRCKACCKARRATVSRRPKPSMSSTERSQARKDSCKRYEKTPMGYLMRTYRNMKSRVLGIQKKSAKLYKGKEIMSKLEFYAWASTEHEFFILFDAWTESGHAHRLAPSIDRIDSSLGYIKGNVRWLTQSQNSELGAQSRFASQISTTRSKHSA